MSIHTALVPSAIIDEVIDNLRVLVMRQYGGIPLRNDYDGTTLTFEHREDITNFAELLATAVTAANLTPSEVTNSRAQLQALRAVRQLTRNQFVNLTEADFRRLVYDAIVADTILWLTLLRDT